MYTRKLSFSHSTFSLQQNKIKHMSSCEMQEMFPLVIITNEIKTLLCKGWHHVTFHSVFLEYYLLFWKIAFVSWKSERKHRPNSLLTYIMFWRLENVYNECGLVFFPVQGEQIIRFINCQCKWLMKRKYC